MLPSYSYYINAHHKAILKPIIIASITLSLCFINNYNDIEFLEFFIGVYAIFSTILYNAINNDKLYWIYCVFSEKFRLDRVSEGIDKYKKLTCYHSFKVVTFISIIFISMFIFWMLSHVILYLTIDNFTFSILIIGGILSPLLIWFFMKVVHYLHFYQAIIFLDNFHSQELHSKKINLSKVIVIEIFFSLVVNFSIVFPISRKASFSLDNGYFNIHFILSLIILLYSVLGVMLFFSRESKINYFMGAILFYQVDSNIEGVKIRGVIERGIMLVFIIPIFSISLCFVFSVFNFSREFFFIYIFSLLPVCFIYYVERRGRLYNAFILAFDMVLRLDALKKNK